MAIKKGWVIFSLLLVIFFVFIYFHKTEKDKIKNKLSLLSELILKKKDESPLYLVSKARKIEPMICETCEIKIPSYGFNKVYLKSEIVSKIMVAQKFSKTLSVNFYDISIELINSSHAEINLTVKVEGITKGFKEFEEPHELNVFAEKIEGEWVFCRFEEVNFLEK